MSAPRGTRTHNFPVKSRLLYAIELERHVFILLLCRLLPANLSIATENPSSDKRRTRFSMQAQCAAVRTGDHQELFRWSFPPRLLSRLRHPFHQSVSFRLSVQTV